MRDDDQLAPAPAIDKNTFSCAKSTRKCNMQATAADAVINRLLLECSCCVCVFLSFFFLLLIIIVVVIISFVFDVFYAPQPSFERAPVNDEPTSGCSARLSELFVVCTLPLCGVCCAATFRLQQEWWRKTTNETHTHANSKIGGKFAFNRPHEIHLTQICLPMRLSCCLLFLSILFFFWILFARLPQLPLCFGIFTFYLHAFCDLNNSLPANTLIFLFLLLCCRFRVCRCNYDCITFCFRWFVDLMVCCTYGNDWSRTRWAHAFKNLSLQILLLMQNFKTDVDLCLLFLLFSVDCTCNQNWNDFH